MCSRTVAAFVALFATLLADMVSAQQVTESEALGLAFPGATLRREEIEPTKAQREAAQKAAGGDVPTRVVRHVATKDGAVVGVAYVDVRLVRTHAQTLLVVVDAKGLVQRVEVLAFAEPKQYRPRPAFFTQFVGRGLDDELQLRRAVRPVAGATLSAVAAVAAVRAMLAVHGAVPVAP
jgi:hypothetical protein